MLGDDVNEALEEQNRNEALRRQQEREKRNKNNQKKNYISKEPNDMMPVIHYQGIIMILLVMILIKILMFPKNPN